MYLTRMELDMRRKKTMLAFANRRLFHGAVEAAFGGERKRRCGELIVWEMRAIF